MLSYDHCIYCKIVSSGVVCFCKHTQKRKWLKFWSVDTEADFKSLFRPNSMHRHRCARAPVLLRTNPHPLSARTASRTNIPNHSVTPTHPPRPCPPGRPGSSAAARAAARAAAAAPLRPRCRQPAAQPTAGCAPPPRRVNVGPGATARNF